MKYIIKINKLGFIFDEKDQRNNALINILKGKVVELDYNGNIEKSREDVRFRFAELPDDYDKKNIMEDNDE